MKTESKRKSKKHAIVRRNVILSLGEKIEKVLIAGDLAPLTPEERVAYYKAVCKSLGLNPLTRPFEYIVFDGKMALYARKDCCEQLRKKYDVCVVTLRREIVDDVCIAEATVKDASGRTDAATGVVSLYKFYNDKRTMLTGKDRDNAIMKAETKAKRRATLSICGLGFLDESEIETVIYNAVTPGGRVIVEPAKHDNPPIAELEDSVQPPAGASLFYVWSEKDEKGYISGHKQLLTENKKLLLFKGKWDKEQNAVVVDAEGLDYLKYELGQRGVPFVPLKAA